MIRCGWRLCALAVEYVEESMRPCPIEPLPGMPAFVRGTSIVRGRATPIVDLRALLGEDADREAARLVTVRTSGERRVGLLVDDVLGLRPAHAVERGALPPLLADASDIVEELARLDGQLLTVLRAGSLLPDDAWARLSETEGSSP